MRWECQSRGLRAGGGGGGAGGRTMPPPRKGGGRRGRRGGRSERRRPAGNGPAGPAGSGAGRRAAAATTEERRRQSFGVGGQRRGGGLRSVPARDSQTPPGTVGISFLTLFLSGNASPGRPKAAVPFASSQMAKLRSRDQAVSETPPSPRYSPMSAAPGTHKYGFMNGRRQVLAGSPGYFAPACGSGAGLGAGSCSEVPVPGRVSLPSGRVPSLAPTPWGGEGRGLPLRQGHRQSACVSSIWEVVRRNGTFRGEPCLEEVVSRLSSALPSVKESTRRVGSCTRQEDPSDPHQQPSKRGWRQARTGR